MGPTSQISVESGDPPLETVVSYQLPGFRVGSSPMTVSSAGAATAFEPPEASFPPPFGPHPASRMSAIEPAASGDRIAAFVGCSSPNHQAALGPILQEPGVRKSRREAAPAGRSRASVRDRAGLADVAAVPGGADGDVVDAHVR